MKIREQMCFHMNYKNQKNKNLKYKQIKLTGEEYLSLAETIEHFLNVGKKENPPKFTIIAGPIGGGKSRFRKERYKEGYVFVDAGEIYLRLTNYESKKPERLDDYMNIIGCEIVKYGIEERKNILIEITMDKEEPIKTIMDKMKEIGYEVNLEFISNSLENCLKNNLNRGEYNISAYYTQDETLHYFSQYFMLFPTRNRF